MSEWLFKRNRSASRHTGATATRRFHFGRVRTGAGDGAGDDPTGPSRRDFLKLAGFAFAGTALAGCQRAPVQYAVPYLVAPEEITPGRSYDYASTCGGCSAGCGLLVKNRDGRPIKLEGNPEHPLSRGGLCAAGQASLLGLYDQQRLQHPLQGGQPAEWAEVDQAIAPSARRHPERERSGAFPDRSSGQPHHPRVAPPVPGHFCRRPARGP